MQMPSFHPDRLVLVSLLAIVLGAADIHAAPVPVDDDTIVVVRVNLEKLDPKSLEAVVAMTGVSAGQLKELAKESVGELAEWQKLGVEAMTVTVTQKNPMEEPDVVVYLHRKAGADDAAIERYIRTILDKGAAEMMATDSRDDALVLHEKDHEPPHDVDSERAKAFAVALAAGGETVAGQMVIIPTDAMRSDFKAHAMPELPAGIKEFAGQVVDTKCLHLVATFGAAPSVRLTVTAADADTAEQFQAAAVVAMAAGKALAMVEKLAAAAGSSEAAQMDAFLALADGIKPVRAGDTISAELTGPAFGGFAGLLARQIIEEHDTANQVRSASNMRQFGQAIILYANDHDGNLPDSLDDVKSYLGEGKDVFKQLMKNPATGEETGYIYIKPDGVTKLSDIAQPAGKPLMYETMKGGEKNEAGFVLYADGHVDKGAGGQ